MAMKTKIRFDAANPALTIQRSKHWKPRMVYILRADKRIKYARGRSRIVYIGETTRGARRAGTSAVLKAMSAFGMGKQKDALHGVRRIDAYPLTFNRRQSVKMWEKLELALLKTFRKMHNELPRYNKKGPRKRFSNKFFREKGLENVLAQLG
jgi:hypothetical protein